MDITDISDLFIRIAALLSVILACIGIFYFLYQSFNTKISNDVDENNKMININSNMIGKYEIKTKIEDILKYTPSIDEQIARSLYLSFRLVLLEYARWEENVVIHPPKDLNIEQGVPIDLESPESFTYFKKYLFDDNRNYKLSEFDKFLITENTESIRNIVHFSNLNYDQDLKDIITYKSIQVKDSDIKISSFEIVFAKYVKFFVLKVK